MTFDSRAYWAKRGKTYEAEAIRGGWWAGEQEHLPDLLATLQFATVLEVGCGFGRVGASILARWPDVTYTGIDISPDLVKAARKRLPNEEIILADMATYETDRHWDLVLAISSLSHVPPDQIGAVIGKLKQWARRDIVVVDWNQIGGQTAYQYGHDVRRLLGRYTRKVTVRGPGQTSTDGRLAMWHLHKRWVT